MSQEINKNPRKPFCPKNVRQIGEIEGSYRIYIEDYVITLLNQVATHQEAGSKAIMLFGDTYAVNGITYYFVNGAVVGKRNKLEDGSAIFDEEEKIYIREMQKKYFGTMMQLGWALIESQFNTISESPVWESGNMFVRMEPDEQMPSIFIREQGIVSRLTGYQIYYDVNEDMQNYLVEWHQQNTYTERVRDVATQQFRTAIKEKKDENIQKKAANFFYMASTVLLIFMCVCGITMLNNYDRLKKVELAMQHLNSQLEVVPVVSNSNTPLGQATQEVTISEETSQEQTIQELPQPEEVESAVEEYTYATSTQEASEASSEAAVVEEKKDDPEVIDTQPETITSEVAKVEEAPKQEEVPKPVEVQSYVIKKGDTLSKISQKYYQTESKVRDICNANGIDNPDDIREGQKIILP